VLVEIAWWEEQLGLEKGLWPRRSTTRRAGSPHGHGPSSAAAPMRKEDGKMKQGAGGGFQEALGRSAAAVVL
jgi:hypothetical protein